MLKRFGCFLAFACFVLVLYSFANAGYKLRKDKVQQENHPPVVKIISPKNNASYPLNTPIQYKIKVSDQEDGESAFQEIPSNEVFVQVKYFTDASEASAEVTTNKSEPAGLTAIKTSNCLNCHAFTGKLIGPSFYDISKRYPFIKANLDLLEKHVREGSTGVWSTVPMPTHPEITKEETQEIVQWILKNGAEPNVYYYRGTEGYFTLKPPAGNANGVFVITASYNDHGLKDKPKQNQRGQDVVIIEGK